MNDLIWLIPLLPLAGFLLLALAGRRMGRALAVIIGVGSVAASAMVALVLAIKFPDGGKIISSTATWFDVSFLHVNFTLSLDALSLVFVLVVTFVGLMILLYSVRYMEEDEGFSRFFAYMDLFIAAMLILVLADNLLLLYLGWEGVGLCSYLLIGFWYRDEANGRAARKAFIVTRIGDTALLLGIFLIVTNLGTLNIGEISYDRAFKFWSADSPMAIAAALLLLGGAVGKSAQLPLQTWLPDAMAGPTPTSALIHAATMVTAGVYLIARMHAVFALAPTVQTITAVVGAVTLLLAGTSALVQRDIKRVLAYSTISQIGYMFMALGAGAWSAGIFHFMAHAFFKPLLFMAAGAVILALHHEQDMFKMGGLRKSMPGVFWLFLIGVASLSALPFVTAGFYSKDMILAQAFDASRGGVWLWAAGVVGAILTSLYSFRMLFLTFCGEGKHTINFRLSLLMWIPMTLLAIFSIVGGFVQTPEWLGNVNIFSKLVNKTLPVTPASHAGHSTEIILLADSVGASLLGLLIAYLLYIRRPGMVAAMVRNPLAGAVHRLWLAGWGFDWLYDRLFVRPLVRLARFNRNDFVDGLVETLSQLVRAVHYLLSAAQTGRLRWYAVGIAAGAILAISIMVLQ